MKVNPAEYVIEMFGGTRATARAVGRAPSAVHGWLVRKCVPLEAQKKILRLAKRRKLDITAEDLITGREKRIAR